MKKYIIALLAFATLGSCTSDNNEDDNSSTSTTVDEIAAATSDAKSISISSAVLGGYLTTGSASSVSDVGVDYVAVSSSDALSSTLFDSKSAISLPMTTGATWNATVSSLKSGTRYAFRAWANNDNGYVYGEIKEFTTSTESTSTGNYSYSGDTASDAALDAVDASDSDHYWENSTFSNTVTVVYNGTTATVASTNSNVVSVVDGAHVAIDLSTNTVKNVEIILSGSTTDGSLKVYSPNKYKLTLNGVSIVSTKGPAINNQGEKRTFVHVSGTNYLEDAAVYSDDIYYYNGATSSTEDRKGCFTSEPHLIFSGTGVLCVKGNYKHAISSDDTFYMRHGVTIAVIGATSDGVHVNDQVDIAGGLLNIISASSDGIECDSGPINVSGGKIEVVSADDAIAASYTDTDTSITPDINITGGEVDITTTDQKGMGLKAEGNINISGGTLTILTKGAAAKCINATGQVNITGGEMELKTTGGTIYENSDTSSAACIKSDGNVTLSDAVITATSSGVGGKGINCGGVLTVNSGTISVTTTGGRYTYGSSTSTGSGWKPGGGSSIAITSSSKGIKSDGNMIINGGKITVSATKSGSTGTVTSGDADGCEGIETKAALTINGGEIEVTAYDDGINASSSITINGGKIYSYAYNNDGIDSNGTITVTGGVVIASGAGAPEEGIDCDQNTFKITGGIIIGTGGAASNPTSSASSQRSLVCSRVNMTQGSVLNISDSSGNTVLNYMAPRTLSSATIVFSSSSVTSGKTYYVYSGGSVSGSTSTWHGYYADGTYSGGSKQSATVSIK